MTRTQIQLPDELYARVRRLADAREVSFAELARRGLELIVDQCAPPELVQAPWQIPSRNMGGLRVSLADASRRAREEESLRSRADVKP